MNTDMDSKSINCKQYVAWPPAKSLLDKAILLEIQSHGAILLLWLKILSHKDRPKCLLFPIRMVTSVTVIS